MQKGELKMIRYSRGFLAVAAVCVFAAVPAARQAQASEWMWSITPYLWGSGVSLNMTVNDREPGFEQTVDFSDLMDKLKLALAGRLEGQRGKVGFFADVFFVDFGDDNKTFDLGRSLPGQVVAETNLAFTIFEAGGIFNPRGDGSGAALLFGARMLDLDLKLDAQYVFDNGSSEGRDYHVNKALWDVLIGARYIGNFGERWPFHVEADASTAGTDLTWSARAGVGYAYGKQRQHAVVVGYRYMDIDLSEPSGPRVDIDIDAQMAGPYLALKFGF
jgi:hypothetical protein